MKKMKNYKKNHGQMIALMGIVLAIAVFVISSLAAEISNINFVVSTESYSSLPEEFNNIKQTFGASLNYNLIDVTIRQDGSVLSDETLLEGHITDLADAFNQTRDEYFNISLKHGYLFDANLSRYWFSHKEIVKPEGAGTNIERTFYSVDITLHLDDGSTQITEDVEYIIVCNQKT